MGQSQVLEDELLAIEAIYPGHICLNHGSDNTFVIHVSGRALLYLSFDHNYPDTSPKLSGVSDPVDREQIEALLHESRGQEVLFSLISHLRKGLEGGLDDAVSLDTQSQSTQNDLGGSAQNIRNRVQWFVAEPIVDRKSTILGRACVVRTEQDLVTALQDIAMDKKLQKATHPAIWACTYTSHLGAVVRQHEDDGETAAGSRLAFLLEVTHAQNVLVLVSRWFGGVLLGDIRFKHITSAARAALQLGSFLDSDQAHSKGKLQCAT